MKATIVPMGNSRGICIPIAILKQCNIENEVEIEVENGKIIIMPAKTEPRKGWNQAFREMSLKGDDELIIADNIDLESFQTMLASEQALCRDWEKAEEEEAWAHL